MSQISGLARGQVLTTFIVEFKDAYLALERVAQLFRRQQVQIEYLTLAHRSILMRLTIVAHLDERPARRLEMLLWKQVNVVSVRVLSGT
jgi:acetolactate synthase small subunit